MKKLTAEKTIRLIDRAREPLLKEAHVQAYAEQEVIDFAVWYTEMDRDKVARAYNRYVNEMRKDAEKQLEEFLVIACKNKGLDLDVGTAHEFQMISHYTDKYQTLVHIPTLTKIAVVSKNPEIGTTIDEHSTKMTATYYYKEL